MSLVRRLRLRESVTRVVIPPPAATEVVQPSLYPEPLVSYIGELASPADAPVLDGPWRADNAKKAYSAAGGQARASEPPALCSRRV